MRSRFFFFFCSWKKKGKDEECEEGKLTLWEKTKPQFVAYTLYVQGNIPTDLVGEFFRNGPNPVFVPRGGQHWFDGDGMIHGVRLQADGNVNYVNRYVDTYRLTVSHVPPSFFGCLFQ